MVVLVQVSMLFLQWIPWLLCMSRPGDQITFKSILMTQKLKVTCFNPTIINIAASSVCAADTSTRFQSIM